MFLAVIQELTSTLTSQSVTCCMSCRRLDQLLKRYERGELHAVDWLDPLALKKIELLRHQVPLAHAVTLVNKMTDWNITAQQTETAAGIQLCIQLCSAQTVLQSLASCGLHCLAF